MVMVRKTTLKTKILSSLALSFIITSAFVSNNFAYATCTVNNGVPECNDGANFQVKIPEILTVSITRPNSWATGELDTLLRNVVTLEVVSNNPAGFTATMTSAADSSDISEDSTANALKNSNTSSSSSIPMLTANWTRSNFSTTKFWGYSTDDASESGTYSAIALKDATTPSSIIPATGAAGTVSQDIYFGAKADSTVDSGVYSGTVIISIVSGTITEDNPFTPTDPATKDDTTTTDPAYDSTNDRTVYTATTYDGTENTSTIEVSEGDTRDAYSDPAGVTTAKIGEGTPLATGLAVTAVVAAVAGIAFFVAARRREEEDDDEY